MGWFGNKKGVDESGNDIKNSSNSNTKSVERKNTDRYSNGLVEVANIEQLISQASHVKNENAILRFIIIAALFIAAGALVFAYQVAMVHIQTPVRETFFAITDDGRLTSLQPESEKYSENMLVQFAKEAGIESFSFDFVEANNEDRMQNVIRKYYSRSGFREYREALEQGQYLRRLYANKEIARATAIGQPILVSTQQVNGKTYYVIRMKLNVDFIAAKDTPEGSAVLNVTMAITRLPVHEAVRGIGITQIQASFEGR